MPNREFKTLAFELKADGTGRRLTGYGAVLHNIDNVGDIIAAGAFKQDLNSFITDGFIGGLNHDWDDPIASIESAKEDAIGLYFTSAGIKPTEMGEKVLSLCSQPDPVVKKLSIGYATLACKYLDEAGCQAYWAGVGYTPTSVDMERAKAGNIRLLVRLKIIEVSPVTKPANDLASIHGLKSLESKDFAEHSLKVASVAREMLEGVDAFIERFSSRADARLKAGRELSGANWDALKDVYDQHTAACDQHKAMCEKMAVLLDRTKPKPKDEPDADDKPTKSSTEPMLAMADIEARYAELIYATLPAV